MDGQTADASLDPRRRSPAIAAVAERSIVTALVAAVALAATALVTFGWTCAKVWSLVDLLIDEGASSSLAIVRLLEVLDVALLGTVVLILAIGLVELFVTPLRLPPWLEVRDLGDLKGKLIDVVQLVAAVKFLEKLVKSDEPLDVLWYALAVAAVILALVAVRLSKKLAG